MADDTAALLRHLGIERADVFGYSMGGAAALQVAIRHPEAVRRLVVASASFTSDGMHPEMLEMIPTITPEVFAGTPIEEEYLRIAPNPDDFPTLVAKLKRLDMEPFAWPAEDILGIAAPTLLIVGDSDVPAARRRRDGRPGRPPEVPAGCAPRHLSLHPPRQRAPGPHRLAALDDPTVPRRPDTREREHRGR
jgi:pimeloyl-ACP methyl ester carboxylesterase